MIIRKSSILVKVLARRRITNLGMPREVAELAQYILDELPGLGFASRTEVVKSAMRQFAMRLIENKMLPPTAVLEGMGKTGRADATKERKKAAEGSI